MELPVIQLSTPELFNTGWESIAKIMQVNKPITPTKVVRPHSAG